MLAEAEAGLRYRKSIGAQERQVFCDIKKKHASHAITSDVDIAECAHAGEFFGADGFVVTGISTGKAASLDDEGRPEGDYLAGDRRFGRDQLRRLAV
ncbi:MAG: hypothetical protein R3B67_13605 [Phycisphaerales bacterium]